MRFNEEWVIQKPMSFVNQTATPFVNTVFTTPETPQCFFCRSVKQIDYGDLIDPQIEPVVEYYHLSCFEDVAYYLRGDTGRKLIDFKYYTQTPGWSAATPDRWPLQQRCFKCNLRSGQGIVFDCGADRGYDKRFRVVHLDCVCPETLESITPADPAELEEALSRLAQCDF